MVEGGEAFHVVCGRINFQHVGCIQNEEEGRHCHHKGPLGVCRSCHRLCGDSREWSSAGPDQRSGGLLLQL